MILVSKLYLTVLALQSHKYVQQLVPVALRNGARRYMPVIDKPLYFLLRCINNYLQYSISFPQQRQRSTIPHTIFAKIGVPASQTSPYRDTIVLLNIPTHFLPSSLLTQYPKHNLIILNPIIIDSCCHKPSPKRYTFLANCLIPSFLSVYPLYPLAWKMEVVDARMSDVEFEIEASLFDVLLGGQW